MALSLEELGTTGATATATATATDINVNPSVRRSYGAALRGSHIPKFGSMEVWSPPPELFMSSLTLQHRKERRHISRIISRKWQKSSSNDNNSDFKEKGLVMVKVKATPNIIEAENCTKIIPEEETVCKFCFHRLFPVDNDHNHQNINSNNSVLKLKCKCKTSLTHELCATEWSGKEGNNNNKCGVCDQDVHYIPVTLSRPTDNSSSITPKLDKGSTLKKLWSCYSCRVV